MFGEEFLARERWFDRRRERMADVTGRDPVRAEELLFKGKYAKQMIDVAFEGLQSALAPSPDLRGDQIGDWYFAFAKVRQQAQVEVRAVGENGKIRLFRVNGRF